MNTDKKKIKIVEKVGKKKRVFYTDWIRLEMVKVKVKF